VRGCALVGRGFPQTRPQQWMRSSLIRSGAIVLCFSLPGQGVPDESTRWLTAPLCPQGGVWQHVQRSVLLFERLPATSLCASDASLQRGPAQKKDCRNCRARCPRSERMLGAGVYLPQEQQDGLLRGVCTSAARVAGGGQRSRLSQQRVEEHNETAKTGA